MSTQAFVTNLTGIHPRWPHAFARFAADPPPRDNGWSCWIFRGKVHVDIGHH
jgi:hypothetical protein